MQAALSRVSEALIGLTVVAFGMSDEDVAKVMGGNWLAFYEANFVAL